MRYLEDNTKWIIKKEDYTTNSMFYHWLLWQADCVPQFRDLFRETILYLLPSKRLILKGYRMDRRLYYLELK